MRSSVLWLCVFGACGGGDLAATDAGGGADAPVETDAPIAADAPSGSADAPSNPDAAPSPDAALGPDAAFSPDAPSSPDAPIVPPVLTSSSVDGQGASKQLRQGLPYAIVILNGTGLAGVTAVTGGDLNPAISMQSATHLRLVVSVPHGHPLGPIAFTAQSPAGSATLTNAVIITEVTVAPSGIDATGRGTPDLPFRTVSTGAAVAYAGDTLRLEAGTYSVGETFPVRIQYETKVAGAGSGVTSIQGASAGELVVLDRGTSLADVRVAAAGGTARDCIKADGGLAVDEEVTIERVEVEGCQTGIQGFLIPVRVVSADIHDVVSGVRMATGNDLNDVQLDVQDTTIRRSMLGIYLEDRAHATISGCHIVERMTTLAGLSLLQHSQATVRDTVVESGPGGVGIDVASDGVTLDFGRPDDPGGNAVYGEFVAIDDERPELPAATGPVLLLTGTTLNGMPFPAGTTATGPVDNRPSWRISAANNRLAF